MHAGQRTPCIANPRFCFFLLCPACRQEKEAAHRRWQEVAKKLALLKEDPERYRQLHGPPSVEP